MNIAVVKYSAGNSKSVENALARLGLVADVTDDHDRIRAADRVIFPGVGEAGAAMADIRASGLDKLLLSLNQPVLGICVGMQILCAWSEESNTECLGVFPYAVKRFRGELKVPHVGWNSISECRVPLFRGVADQSFVYFVHSYFVELGDATAAVCEYGERFSAALHRDNFYAVQFHTEKSGGVGEQILKNFIEV